MQLIDHLIQATRVDRERWQRYAFAAAVAASALTASWLTHRALGLAMPFLFYFPAIAAAGWFGGLGSGLFATALIGLATTIYPFDNALGPDGAGWLAGVFRSVGFLATGVVVSILSEVLHEARRQQHEGRERAQRMVKLQTRLDEVTMAFAESLQVPEVAEIVVEQGRALLGASASTLAVMDERGGALRTVYAVGYPPGVEVHRLISLESDEPLAEAVRSRSPVFIESRKVSDARYPHLAPVRNITGTEAVAALPLIVRGRVLGGIGFSFRQPLKIRYAELPYVQALAYHAALALEATRRYEGEQAARRRAEASDARHRFLAGANALLAASMDFEVSLRKVTRLAVPTFAEACLTHLRTLEGGLSLLAAYHVDPGRSEALEELGRRHLEPEQTSGFWRTMHSRIPELLSDAQSRWSERAVDAEERTLVEGLDVDSSLSVPLVARNRSLGVITFLASRDRRALTANDLALAVDLAERAAGAIDNALLFREAQRLNRVKDEFLALLSHELRTPLGSVLLWLELLRSEQLEPAASRAADMIQRSARQLGELIDQLLDVSRIVAGKLSIEKQATDLPGIVDGVLESAGPAADAKGVRLQAEVDHSLGLVWADPNRMRQALANLVFNAIKFTPEAGIVSVRLERLGAKARLQVRDTGAGIAPDLLPYIFERFRQGDAKSTRAHGGLGLGLAIVHYVAEQHEGTIRAHSDGPGRGSVFTLDLPLRLPPSRPLVAQAPSRNGGPERPLSKVRVLLVDDHPDTLQGLASALAASGGEITAVSTARDALAALPRVHPHVIVSDLAMPDQDGYALIREVRGLAPDAGGLIPAVAVSAYASSDDRQRALHAGFQEHLAKPVEITQLVATVVRLAGVGSSGTVSLAG